MAAMRVVGWYRSVAVLNYHLHAHNYHYLQSPNKILKTLLRVLFRICQSTTKQFTHFFSLPQNFNQSRLAQLVIKFHNKEILAIKFFPSITNALGSDTAKAHGSSRNSVPT